RHHRSTSLRHWLAQLPTRDSRKPETGSNAFSRCGTVRLQPYTYVSGHARFLHAEYPGKDEPVLVGSTHSGCCCIAGGRFRLLGKVSAVTLDHRSIGGRGGRTACLVPVLPAHPASHLYSG